MRRLIRHIEQALYKHECVVLPGFGAFIKHRVPSALDESKGLIYPGCCALSFNSAVQQNDGILVGSYVEAFAMSYKRALSLLEKDVEELCAALRSSSIVTLGSVGRLSMDHQGGRIVFYPNADHPFSISQYGLRPIAQLPLLPSAAVSSATMKSEKREDVYYLPIPVRGLKYGAAAAALLAMTWLIPVKKISIPTEGYQAGFFTSMLEKSNEQTGVVASLHVAEDDQMQEREKKSDAVQSQDLVEIAGLPLVSEVGDSARYFVVVATYKTEGGVEKHLRHHDLSLFPHAGVLRIEGERNYKIYVADFSSMEEAVAYTNTTLKEINPKLSAWVLRAK